MPIDYQGEPLIRVRDVRRVYRMGDVEVHALRGITLDVHRGEYISIMGPSGSGKSTLFNMVGALDTPTDGKVYFWGTDLRDLDARDSAWVRCRYIGYIFQAYNLIPLMTALENVTLPMTFAGYSNEDAREKGKMLLDLVGLGKRGDQEPRYHHKPHELSGGQQQRVAIARSLANCPVVLLADEPTGNLDMATGKEIIDVMKQLNTDIGVTVISATHDDKMLSASDRVVTIRDGKVNRIQNRDELDIQLGTLDGSAIGETKGGEAYQEGLVDKSKIEILLEYYEGKRPKPRSQGKSRNPFSRFLAHFYRGD